MEIRTKVHLRTGYRGKGEVARGTPFVPPTEARRPHRKAELMAFAIVFDDWLASGRVRDYAQISQIMGISRFRLSKIMNYTQLSLREQKELLYKTV